MTLRTRLQRLEKQAAATKQHAPKSEFSERESLARLAAWGREGRFDREPDFPEALAAYGRALNEAAERPDYNPPADFMSGMVQWPKRRAFHWRMLHFPDVRVAWYWLLEIHTRVSEGIPPVSVAEFGELADWFRANEERLYRLAQQTQLLDLGDGRRESIASIRWRISQGVKALGAGDVAEELRRLRAQYGETNTP